MAENLVEMGISTSLIELGSQILAQTDSEIAAVAQNVMRDNGTELILSDGVKEFNGNNIILNSGRKVEFDIIIMAVGIKPAVELAKNTHYAFRIVTLDGDIINPQGSITGGSRKNDIANIFSHERELKQLGAAVSKMQKEYDICRVGHAAAFVGGWNGETVVPAHFFNPYFHFVVYYIQAAFRNDDRPLPDVFFGLYYEAASVYKQLVGLRKINAVVEHEATPSILGMVQKVRHLVEVIK